MQPIVDGLEAEFAGQLAFEQQLADTANGRARMSACAVRGHPSYVLVGPDGEMRWSTTGTVPPETLRQQIQHAVE